MQRHGASRRRHAHALPPTVPPPPAVHAARRRPLPPPAAAPSRRRPPSRRRRPRLAPSSTPTPTPARLTPPAGPRAPERAPRRRPRPRTPAASTNARSTRACRSRRRRACAGERRRGTASAGDPAPSASAARKLTSKATPCGIARGASSMTVACAEHCTIGIGGGSNSRRPCPPPGRWQSRAPRARRRRRAHHAPGLVELQVVLVLRGSGVGRVVLHVLKEGVVRAPPDGQPGAAQREHARVGRAHLGGRRRQRHRR